MSQPALHGTACRVCRRRGRKCDRTLPTCLSCGKRGVQCEGYVMRWPGVAARGKLAGKSVPILDTKTADTSKFKSLSKGNKPNSLSSDPILNVYMLDQALLHLEPLGALDSEHLDDVEIDRLVRHYVEDLSRIFYLGEETSNNPMSTYVLPLAKTVPPVRYALAASAACHTAARNSDESLDQKSLSLRVHTTRLMRERLRDPRLTTHETMLPSILMLAQLDMCSGDCTEFETHMQAGVAMCRDSRADHASNNFYFEQRLAWLDIISSTTSTRLPFFSERELKAALGRLSTAGVRNWSYDVFPCPVDLSEMILDITMLYKTQALGAAVSKTDVIGRAHAIMDRLRTWTSGSEALRGHMIEVWRLGAIAFLLRLFPEAFDGERMATMKALMAEILQWAQLVPPATCWSFALLWPIFQAAVSLEDSAVSEKTWIRGYLCQSLGAVGCRHFSNALDALEHVWSNHDRLAFTATGTLGRTIMLG